MAMLNNQMVHVYPIVGPTQFPFFGLIHYCQLGSPWFDRCHVKVRHWQSWILRRDASAGQKEAGSFAKGFQCMVLMRIWWRSQNSGKIERNFEGYFMPEQRKSPGTSKSQVACRKGHAEIVLLLCAARANLETQDDDGQTCLMAACNAGHTGIVRDSGVGKTGSYRNASI